MSRQHEVADLYACLDCIHRDVSSTSRIGLAYSSTDYYGFRMYVVLGPGGRVSGSTSSLGDAIEDYRQGGSNLVSLARLYELCAQDWEPVDPMSPLERLARSADD